MNSKRYPARQLAMALLASAMLILTACGERGTEAGAATEQAVAVRTALATSQQVQTELESVGRLVSKNTPLLSSEVNARVVEVLVEDGLAVEQGQVLIRLDTTTFELAREEGRAAIRSLQISIANEERRVKRYRNLKSTNAMSQERLDDAEAKLAADRAAMTAAEARLAIAQDQLDKAALVSPVSGVVQRRHVSVGDYVKTGTPLVTLTDTQNLRAELPFPETVGHLLRAGQRVHLESPVAPGIEIEARIDQILPQVGSVNRALIVLSEVSNPGPWRPEAAVAASVVVSERESAVVVPYIAVVERPAGNVVYVLEGERVRQQVVEPGERQNGWIEIRSGLDAGLTVIADGAYYLSDGALVDVRNDPS